MRDEMQESLQSKAKAVADCVVQAQEREMLKVGEKAVLRHMRKVFGKWGSRTLWRQSGRRNQVEHAVEIRRRSGDEN